MGSGKFSQSSTGYLPSAVNVLTNTTRISPITRGDIFQINFPQNDEKHDKIAVMDISQGSGTLSHVDSQRIFWNSAFYRLV